MVQQISVFSLITHKLSIHGSSLPFADGIFGESFIKRISYTMKLDLCLVPADYAAPIRSNAARTAVDLTTAQLKAIEAAVKRKFEKQRGLGQKVKERLVWQTIAAAALVNNKAKFAK